MARHSKYYGSQSNFDLQHGKYPPRLLHFNQQVACLFKLFLFDFYVSKGISQVFIAENDRCPDLKHCWCH